MIKKKYHVKKGDKVKVISGNWKGETATILAVLNQKDRVVLEASEFSAGKRNSIGKKTIKKSAENPSGGLIERSVSVHVSNVQPITE